MFFTLDHIRKRHQGTDSRGFTLLEVLLSISIFSIGVLAIAALQVAALKSNQTSRGVTEAVALAENQTETLIAIPYDPDNVHADLANGAHDGGTQDGYTLSWTVAAHPSINNAITIRINVSWWDKGFQKTVDLDFSRVKDV